MAYYLVHYAGLVEIFDFSSSFDTKGRMITVAQLMDHTSGIASYTEIPSFWELSLHNYPKDTLVTIVENTDFLFI